MMPSAKENVGHSARHPVEGGEGERKREEAAEAPQCPGLQGVGLPRVLGEKRRKERGGGKGDMPEKNGSRHSCGWEGKERKKKEGYTFARTISPSKKFSSTRRIVRREGEREEGLYCPCVKGMPFIFERDPVREEGRRGKERRRRPLGDRYSLLQRRLHQLFRRKRRCRKNGGGRRRRKEKRQKATSGRSHRYASASQVSA